MASEVGQPQVRDPWPSWGQPHLYFHHNISNGKAHASRLFRVKQRKLKVVGLNKGPEGKFSEVLKLPPKQPSTWKPILSLLSGSTEAWPKSVKIWEGAKGSNGVESPWSTIGKLHTKCISQESMLAGQQHYAALLVLVRTQIPGMSLCRLIRLSWTRAHKLMPGVMTYYHDVVYN